MGKASDAPLPRENAYFVGHEAAEKTFLDAWESGRLAHAWLINGPEGIGKATLAYRMARHLLSRTYSDLRLGLFDEALPTTLQMNPDHPVFKKVAAMGHSDIRVVERPWADTKQSKRKTVIGVNEVREIGAFMRLTPGEGGWRVVIIDAADEMNRNAANAVLKVLEEPPQRALLFLVSHNSARLLPTIRSRCRKLSLGPLDSSTIASLAQRYRPGLDKTEINSLAVLADGSIGRALKLADIGGLDLFRQVTSVLGTLPKLDIGMAHALGDTAAKGESFRTVADLLIWWLARMVNLEARNKWMDTPEIIPGEHAIAKKLKDSASLDHWVEVWEKVGRLFNRADAVHLDKKRTILNALLTIEQTATG